MAKAKKLKSLEDVPVDAFEAVKRALIRYGFIPGKPGISKAETSRSQDESKQDDKEEAKLTPSKLTGSPEPQEVQEKLIDITEKAQDVLCQADTVFPFTLFPDTITVDREKLTVATRFFFRMAKIISVPVDSILSAEVDVGPFFGSVHMTSKYFVQNAYSVNFLWRKDAIRIQHILQGFIIAHEKKLDVTDIDKEDLIILLNDLGQGVSD